MALQNKKLSIIMSVYNEPELMLRESIESIINQSFKDFEYIIVLDNPNNKKLETLILSYAYKDDRIVFIKNKKNIGLANSLNKAMKVAKCDLIARMDADDISLQDRLERQVNYLNNNSQIDFIGSGIEYVDEQGCSLNKKNTVISSEKMIQQLLPYGNLFNHPTWMFRKRILNDVIGYRQFSSSQDYDFALRVKYYGYRLTNMNEVMLKYRVRNNSISVSRKLYQLKMVIYIQNLYLERLKKDEDNFNVKVVEQIDNSNMERFKNANEIYENAMICFKKKKYIKVIYLVLKSILISREQRKLFYNYIMIKHIISKENRLNKKFI